MSLNSYSLNLFSSENEEEEEDDHLEFEEEEEEDILNKSDHEFSMESDVDDDESWQPVKRARTAKKGIFSIIMIFICCR